MAYTNLPPSLQHMFTDTANRLLKLENGQRFTAPTVPILTTPPTISGLASTDPQYPRVGDIWLNTANNALRYIDATGAAQNVSSPSGAITAFAGATAPSGWLLCDGSAISRTAYASLFAVLSTTYGVGDGSTTFNLPNLQGRFPVGKDTSTEFGSLGASGGSKAHTHPLSNAGYAKGGSNAGGTRFIFESVSATSWTADTGVTGTVSAASQSVTSGIGLGGQTDAATGTNGLPPFLVINYIIKA